ncbi:MAG: LuxR C-terminal-related transcriptional regulator, partial [Dermatophilaceae bacterium]
GDQLRWPFLQVATAEAMLRQYLRGGTGFSDDLRKVLDQASPASSSRARRTAPGMVDSLTERELAVLAYLPRRIKHRDIAAELYITMNTLKTHLASIYRKLGVSDRDEAATRAAELGLL